MLENYATKSLATIVLALALISASSLANAQTLRVKCEVRDDRSRISVDGRDLLPLDGDFKAVVESGTNLQMSDAQMALGDEAEFDFDSAQDDIDDGATALAADFIDATSMVTGTIRTADGGFVAAATVRCKDRR